MANPTLTEEQVGILKDAFSSYPENWKVSEHLPLYTSREGVKEQIESCEYRTALVFYATAEKEEEGMVKLKLNKREVKDPAEMSIEEAEATFEQMSGLSFSDYLLQSELCNTV